MNRPLAAIGALMTFLVLAMFAVSSTSRSTSVQAARPAMRVDLSLGRRELRTDGQVQSIANSAIALHVTDDCAGHDFVDYSRLAGECGAVTCGRVMAETFLTSLRVQGNRQSKLTAVRVLSAADANEAWRTTALSGCLSYYDAKYDRIVYGEGEEPKFQRTEELKYQESSGIGDEEMAALFYDLVDARRGASGAAEEVVGTDTSGIDWSDYAELIDQPSKVPAITVEAAKTSGSSQGVRSSDWLRHSAALSLYRVGALLQAAALEVEQANENSSD